MSTQTNFGIYSVTLTTALHVNQLRNSDLCFSSRNNKSLTKVLCIIDFNMMFHFGRSNHMQFVTVIKRTEDKHQTCITVNHACNTTKIINIFIMT